MHDVLGVRPDPAQDAKHGLDEERRLDEAALKEVTEVVEMRRVVALELEPRPGIGKRAQTNSMSLNVLRNTRSREFSSACASQSCSKVLKRLSIGKSPKFIEPMLRDATSGLKVSAGFTRSCTVMKGAPPVVRLITAFVDCLMRGRKRAKASGALIGTAGLLVPRVQVDDRGAGFRRADRGLGDLVGRDRKVRRH